MKIRKKAGGSPPAVHAKLFRLNVSITLQRDFATVTDVTARRLDSSDIYDRLTFSNGRPQPVLEAEIDALVELLDKASARQWAPDAIVPQPDEAIEDFQRLGRDLFEHLFDDADTVKAGEQRETLRNWLDSANLEKIVVNRYSCPATFPLDLLWYRTGLDPKNREHYIGVRAPVLHLPLEGHDRFVVNEAVPTIGFLGHKELTSVNLNDAESIHAVFDKLPGCTVHLMTPLKEPDHKTEMPKADAHALARAMKKFRNVWHVTSHTRQVGIGRGFKLDNELTVTVSDLTSTARPFGRFVGKPLVFLNFCDTGTGSRVDDSNLASAFGKLGAGAVIATRTRVYERFATHFAEGLYSIAFTDEFVARALFKARRRSVLQDGTIAALTYFCEAEHDFKLPIAKDLTANDDSNEVQRAVTK